jgi:hypothetical protein
MPHLGLAVAEVGLAGRDAAPCRGLRCHLLRKELDVGNDILEGGRAPKGDDQRPTGYPAHSTLRPTPL